MLKLTALITGVTGAAFALTVAIAHALKDHKMG